MVPFLSRSSNPWRGSDRTSSASFISKVKTIKQVDIKLALQCLHKTHRFINGAAAGACLCFVNNQYQKAIIAHLCFSFKLIVVCCPLGSKGVQDVVVFVLPLHQLTSYRTDRPILLNFLKIAYTKLSNYYLGLYFCCHGKISSAKKQKNSFYSFLLS
jgi:hypothetical protein